MYHDDRIVSMRDISSISKPESIVGVRVNIETDIVDGSIVNESNHKAHATTIQQLVDANMKIIVFAHHKSELDDIMHMHADILRNYVNANSIYVAEDTNLSSIVKDMDNSDIVIYPNLSEVEGGMTNYDTVKKSSQSQLAKDISREVDAFVNDAFSISYKNYPTVTGVPYLKPGYAGNVMKSEYEVLNIFNDKNPLFVFGGTKLDERVSMIKKVLESNIDTDILLGGLVASVFLYSKGYELGSDTKEDINRHSESSRIIDEASNIMTKFSSRIHLPKDIAVENNGRRQEFTISASPFPSRIKDIGSRTNEQFGEKVTSSNSVIGIGPLGVAEEGKFSSGTETVYEQISKSQPSAIYGDTTAQICEDLGITGFSHTSRGDEAVCEYLSSNEEPPGISILLPENSESNEKSLA